MATEASSLSNLSSLMSLLTGKTGVTTATDSGSTSTSKTQLDETTVAKLLQTALESNSGLASVVAGQQGSGMYNSTVNTQLTNDLLSRLSTQVAATAAPKVTTTTPSIKTSTTKNPAATQNLLGLAALSVAKKPLDKLINDPASTVDAVSKALGLSSSVGIDKIAGGSVPEVGNTMADSSINLLTASDAAAVGADFSTNAASALAQDAAESMMTDTGTQFASNAAEALAQDTAESVMEDAGSNVATNVASNSTVICTEAQRQGLLPIGYYTAEIEWLKKNPVPEVTLRGYHYLAAPAVAAMKNNSNVAIFFARWAKAYIEHTALNNKSWRGYFVCAFLLPICAAVGYFLTLVEVPCNG